MNQQGSNADSDFAIRRALTGLCSIGLLVGWGAVLYFGDQDDTVAPILMRLGLVTGALWLALPELRGLFKNISGTKALVALTLAIANLLADLLNPLVSLLLQLAHWPIENFQLPLNFLLAALQLAPLRK